MRRFLKIFIITFLLIFCVIFASSCGEEQGPLAPAGTEDPANDPWADGDPFADEEDLTDPEDASDEGGQKPQGDGHVTDAVGNPLQEDETLEVKKMDLGGYEVRILQKDTTEGEMYAERRRGELINDAVYLRNQYVENYLGVKLKYETAAVKSGGVEAFESKVKGAVSSGYDMYHVAVNNTYEASALIQAGYYLDFNSISADRNSIDLSKRWWNQSFYKEALLDDKLFMLTGDITTTAIDSAEVVFVNNGLLDSYLGLTEAELMQSVYEMEWDYELFLNYVHMAGTGAESGIWGFVGDRGSYSIDGMIMGMAMDLTYRDSFNYPNMKVNTTRNVEIGERLRNLFQQDASANCVDSARVNFAAGKAVFMTHTLGTAGVELKSSSVDYLVIPVPMFDGFQEEYRIVPQDNFSSLSLPTTADAGNGLTAITAVLEVMGSESYINLRHCIQEKCYKQRYLKTEPRGIMFDYIVDNMYYDFGYTYGKVLDKPVMLIRNYARYASGEQGYIESLATSLIDLEDRAAGKLSTYLALFFE